MNKENLLGVNIRNGKFADFIAEMLSLARSGKSTYCCVTSVHGIIESYKDSAFAAIQNDADIVTPDGKPLTWGLRLLYGIRQAQIAGMEILPALLVESELNQIPVFFYGGTEKVLSAGRNYLWQKYPALKIVGMFSPPFRTLSSTEEQKIINQINESGAKIVFVILGCPKQEKWMASMKGRINALMIGIGGALHVVIGLQPRAPKWMRNIGLEWFFRLILEPQRLFKRYAIINSVFLFLLIREFVKIIIFRRIIPK